MSEDEKAQESIEDIRKLLRYVIKSSDKIHKRFKMVKMFQNSFPIYAIVK